MEYRPLEITILSANNLKKVNLFTTMNVYVVATVAGDPRTTQRTEVAKGGGRNPTWNCPMSFAVNVTAAAGANHRNHHHHHHLMLTFKLKSKRTFGDKDIGEVHVPVTDLLNQASDDPKSVKFVSYQVRRRSAGPKGVLNFSYRFGEMVAGAGEIRALDTNQRLVAYPAASNAVYPPIDTGRAGRPGGCPERMGRYGYWHGYRPVGGSGHGYQMYSGHGRQDVGGSGGFGMGVGAGLLGGGLGLGVLLQGDTVADSMGFERGDGSDF